MSNQEISKEYNKRINTVVNYILKNLKDELSMHKLAKLANYAPHHFRRIFIQVVGESPKQYIIRMRLENAAHYLAIHPHKSITEIALDSGFASPATFARAFKNYFGVSAEQLKNLSSTEKIELRKEKKNKTQKIEANADFMSHQYDSAFWSSNLKISVKKTTFFRAIFINTPLSDTKLMQDGFKKIIQLADTHDLLTTDTKFIGIINPHQGLYRTALTISEHHKTPKDIATTDIEAGKFASYKIKGDTLQTFHSLHAFYELWLPNSGYRIADPNGFEILSQNPATTPYHKIEREIYIAIEPT